MSRYESIREALKIFKLPVLVSLKDIKRKYRELSKKYHPDVSDESDKMVDLNRAYRVLVEYMENYKFTFSEDEIKKQFPEEQHAERFRF
jgi:DnaJ-class molecular chaperone